MIVPGAPVATVALHRAATCQTRAAMRVAVPLEQCWHEVPGGTARTSIDLTAAVLSRGDVELVGVAARHHELPEPTWHPPIPVRHLPLPRLALYEAWHGLGRPRVEAASGAVDVMHNMAGVCAPSRAPMVATIHDLAFLQHPDLYTRHGLRFHHRALTLMRRRAERVFVPSMATFASCVDAGIGGDRLVHVPWGIAPTTVGPEAIDLVRTRFGIEGRYVVVVGTLEPRKNLRRLLEAWQELDPDDVELIVAGPSGWGDSGLDPALLHRVRPVGFVDMPTRDALYAGAELSVYPSIFEGFGLPVLESMALGCPVLTSSGTATEELVADGGGLAIDPFDSTAIAAGLDAVLGDPALRERLASETTEVARRYTWASAAETTVQVYREVSCTSG